MKIIYYGGKQASIVGLLTLLAEGMDVICVIPEKDGILEPLARKLNMNIKNPENINDASFVSYLKSLNPDLLFCVHGRQILKKDMLSIGCVNVHPCLYKYKGLRPIKKLLEDKNTKASVGVHWMSEKVDEGKIIIENFKEIKGKTELEVYNELYPLYVETILDALNILKKELKN